MFRVLCKEITKRNLLRNPRLLKHSGATQLSTSAAQHNVNNTMAPVELRSSWSSGNDKTFDVKELASLLDHDNHEMRGEFRKFVSDPIMTPRYDIPLAEERDVALQRLKRICDGGFISVLDFNDNPLRIFAAHELAAIIDPAMSTKMTVQFNLFGGTVL
uniref:Uncharacterized protein n=1 Tax=Ciona savignyi TaxID=51511 RepID=H2YL24_CIOSA